MFKQSQVRAKRTVGVATGRVGLELVRLKSHDSHDGAVIAVHFLLQNVKMNYLPTVSIKITEC